MVKDLYELEGRGYLKSNNSENYEMYKDLYFGVHYKHFPINEIEYKLSEKDYISYNLIGFGVDAITNLFGINKATFDFSSSELNNFFEAKRKTIDFDEKIQIMIRDYRIYGNSYVIVNQNTDNDLTTTTIENVNPAIVYADYNEYNLSQEAKKYTVLYEKEIDEKKEVYLVIDYLLGQIVISAYLEEGENYRQVKPIDYFPELVNSSEEVITIETGINYLSLIALHNTQKNSFYGESQINNSVISLQQTVNRLGNLANFVITHNSVPRLKLSEDSAKILQNVIDDNNNGGSLPMPESFTERPRQINSFQNVSWAFSSIVAKMGQKLMYFKESGRGSTEYLINNYKLDDLFKFQTESEQKLLKELKVSPALYNSDMASGNLASGIAYKRLLELSIKEVENMRVKSQDQISKIAQILVQLELGKEVPAPKVEFQPVIEEEVLQQNLTNVENTLQS